MPVEWAHTARYAEAVTRPLRTSAQRREAAEKLVKDGRPVSTGTAALLLAVDRKTVARWCRDGKVETAGKTPGGHWRIPADEIARHMPGTTRETG